MIVIRCLLLAAVAMGAMAPTVARGHFLWVHVANAGQSPRAEVYFSETSSPGSAHLIDQVRSATAWVSVPGAPLRELDLKPWQDDTGESGGLAATLSGADACRVEVAWRYGVFDRGERPVLLHYCAKALHGMTANNLDRWAPAERLVLDIVPTIVDERLVLTVRFRGEPLAGCPIVIETTGDERQDAKTDADGTVTLPLASHRQCVLRATHLVDRRGTLQGRPYAAEMYVATLTFRAADATPAEDPSATALLEKARAARAIWENFPGFSATLSIRVDEEREEGSIVVDADGDVSLQGIDRLNSEFVRQQIDSLVMHRLPGSAFDVGARYEPEPGLHVMGRRVRLAEERMGSVYRIRDQMITEVNRTMGKQRFTISVLDVTRNAEGKYLPHVFTVSFWDNQSGALLASHTYLQEWSRLESYDLPRRMLIISSDKTGRRVTELVFSDHRLLSVQADDATE